MFKNRRYDIQVGFTLIELLIVIALIGILAVTIMPRFTATGHSLEYEARRLLNDIRYTQALSMLTGERYRWIRSSANSYQIQNEAGSSIMLPNGSTEVTFTSGVMFGAMSNLPGGLIAFSSLGVPYVSVGTPGTALTSVASIALTAGGNVKIIQILPQTGYGTVS